MHSCVGLNVFQIRRPCGRDQAEPLQVNDKAEPIKLEVDGAVDPPSPQVEGVKSRKAGRPDDRRSVKIMVHARVQTHARFALPLQTHGGCDATVCV